MPSGRCTVTRSSPHRDFVTTKGKRAPRSGWNGWVTRICGASTAPGAFCSFEEGEKSRRQIQYLRHAFFAARPFRDLDDINAQFRRWRDEVAHRRRHPDQPARSVADVWAEEKPRLLPLPAHPFETDLVRVVRSGKTPYVRFDRNS